MQVRLDTAVREVTPDTVILGDNTMLRADLTIWVAGVTAATAVHEWGLPQGRGGRIIVDDHLRVAGQPEIFAAGDLALIDGQSLAQQAQPAIQTGTHAGRQIRHLLAGQATRPFHYCDKGSMATIGRNKAVADLHAVHLSGFPAWLVWLFVHIIFLVGFRNRIVVLLQWAWSYVTFNKGARLITRNFQAETRPPA